MSTSDTPTPRGARTPVPPRGGKKGRSSGRPPTAKAATAKAATGNSGAGNTSTGRPSSGKGAAANAPGGKAPRQGQAHQPSAPARRTSAKGGPAGWQARRRRRRMNMAIGGIVAVVVVVGVLIGIKVAGSGSGKATVATTAARPAPASVIGEVTGAPLAALAQASNGATTIQGLTALTGQPPLTSAGKPTMLYIGAEFCPYCAAERWVMVAALAKFGTFSNLGETSSASGDVYPNSPTFSFVGSSYNSRYLNFQAVETTTNQLNSAGTGYVPLDSPTAAQTKLWKSLDPSQGIPFVDIAGKWLITTSGYVPSIISNKPMDYVAAQVGDNNTAVGKAIDQAAGVLVNDICSVTGDQPANVCNAVTAKG